jgi:hypothetical protein
MTPDIPKIDPDRQLDPGASAWYGGLPRLTDNDPGLPNISSLTVGRFN